MKINNIKVDWDYLPYSDSFVCFAVIFPLMSFSIFNIIYTFINPSFSSGFMPVLIPSMVCIFNASYLAAGFAIGFKRQCEDVIYGFCDGCYVTIDGSTHFKQSNTVCTDCKYIAKK